MSIKNFLRRFSPRHQIIDLAAKALPGSICIDVGASYYPHIQWQPFLRSPETRWITVEPNEKNLAYVKDWRWESQVKLIPKGLSRTGGKQELYRTNVDSGSSLLPPVVKAGMQHRLQDPSYFFPFQKIPIDTLALSQVILEESGTSPVFIKLDTQGTELDILRGAEDLLRAHRVVGIELEATLLAEPWMEGSGKFWQVSEFLEALGFELVHLKPIQGIRSLKGNNPKANRYLNECDAVFTLRRDVVSQCRVEYRLCLLAFYISYALYEEAHYLLRDDRDLGSYLESKHVTPTVLHKVLSKLF